MISPGWILYLNNTSNIKDNNFNGFTLPKFCVAKTIVMSLYDIKCPIKKGQ
jgi:hypothetical protein